jgi:hypothetical protein
VWELAAKRSVVYMVSNVRCVEGLSRKMNGICLENQVFVCKAIGVLGLA